MINKNKTPKLSLLRKKLIQDKSPQRCFSFSSTNKNVKENKININNSLKKQCLKRKNIRRKSTIQINYKGVSKKIRKVDYYKMKNVDISKLIAQRNEKIELIKQKKIFMEKENNIFNREQMDLISKLKEKEYRREITNLQKKMLNIKEQKNEIYEYYKLILSIIKDIENKTNWEVENPKNLTQNKINSDINKINIEFINKFNKKCEDSDYVSYIVIKLIEKMDIIIKSHLLINNKIKSFNEQNISLKKKIKEMNDINDNLCKRIKKIKMNTNKLDNDPNNEDEKRVLPIYRKIQKIPTQKYIERGNNEKNRILSKKIIMNSDFNIGQTYYTSNNINILTNKSNSKNNILSFSNNFVSITSSSVQNQEKTNEKINKKENNYIMQLKNKIKNLKLKIKEMKTSLNKPKNVFYNLVTKIIKKLNDEEVDIVNDNIDYKLLNDNMRIFPYQSYKTRKKFLDNLLYDVDLYKIFNSKNLEGINYFQFSLFNQDKEK